MRVRETTTGDLLSEYYSESIRPASGQFLGSETTWGGSRVQKTITDVETPGFAALKKCGKFLPLNPVTIVTRNDEQIPHVGIEYETPGYFGIRKSGSVFRYASSYAYPGMIPVPDECPPLDNARLEAAVIAARANAASDKWDFLTFLAEMRGTVEVMQQLGSAFNARTIQLAVEASAFKKNPWKRFRELWLGARYSIRPLIYDFYSAKLALSRLMDDQALLKGTGLQVEEVVSEYDSGWLTSLSAPETRRHRQWLTLDRKYRSSAYVTVDSRIDSAIQFDPLLTSWELIPYSFVVDWFVNIGAWVSTLTPTLQGDFAGTCWSVKDTYTYLYTSDVAASPVMPGVISEATPCIHRISWEQYQRAPYDGLPFPSLLPDITMPRLVDLVALFVKGRNQTTRILNRR